EGVRRVGSGGRGRRARPGAGSGGRPPGRRSRAQARQGGGPGGAPGLRQADQMTAPGGAARSSAGRPGGRTMAVCIGRKMQMAAQRPRSDGPRSTSRRRLIRWAAMAAVAGQTLARSGSLRAALWEARESDALASPWPAMTYRTLGRTGHRASRLVFGCGAALSSRRRDELLETAFDAGINVFDVGFKHYYDDAERNLAPFLKRRRGQVFLISKAIVPGEFGPGDPITASQARTAAAGWARLLDESLAELEVDHVDAYYLMASNNPALITSDEIHRAFERARDAGKVRFLGLSTHQNAQAVLEAATASERFDLAMIAITPGGWYDWETREVL